MRTAFALAFIALPIAAQAQYVNQNNYDRHGNYVVRPPQVSTTITPNGTFTTVPMNNQHPEWGSTTTGPGTFCTTTPNSTVHPYAYGSTTVCR